DEFMWEPYGSAMVMKLAGGLDAQGNIVGWSHELWSHPHSARPGASAGVNLLAAQHLANPLLRQLPADVPQPAGGSDRNSIPLYELPNVKVVKHYLQEAPLRTSALRTLGGYANVFALESFMDELAAAAQSDPVEFRLRHMKDPRARAVIEAAAQRAGWTPKPGDRTRVTTRSWADYPILRFEEVPQVEVVILNQPNERFLGVGEGAQGPAAAAIANAIANATGVRLRDLPFTPARVKAALA